MHPKKCELLYNKRLTNHLKFGVLNIVREFHVVVKNACIFVMSVYPSAINLSAHTIAVPTGHITMKFDIGDFHKKKIC